MEVRFLSRAQDMIEIEKKFILTEEQKKRLLEGAEFLGEKKFTDTYYDDAQYSLTTRDVWLRVRDGKFELKVPMNMAIEERVIDRYQELEADSEIAVYLGLPKDRVLMDVLRKNGYAPFSTIVTTRKKYKKDGYHIDLDATDFGYHIAEIEYMVNERSEIEKATRRILDYGKAYGLSGNGVIRGKVAEYLRKNSPVHFQALVEAKVIK
jgi:adenylate cyclase class IV